MRSSVFLVIVFALALGSLPAVAGVEYNFESGTEGWTSSGAANGLANFGASGGALGFDYVEPTAAFDPMIISPIISLPASAEHWLVLEVNITAANNNPVTFQVFFSSNVGPFSEGRSRILTVTPNLGWQTLEPFDMRDTQGGRDPWAGTITGFRIDPGSNPAPLVGYRCDFQKIALTGDTDNDRIPDDAELLYFGNLTEADDTTDHDANEIPDFLEIQFGLDPTTDAGESLPTTEASGVALLAACLALLGTVIVRRIAEARIRRR